MRGKTRGEARDELLKAGMKGDALNALIPHKVWGAARFVIGIMLQGCI